MRCSVFFSVLATACAPLRAGSVGVQMPTYTAGQLVNSADYVAGALAPNTIAALFGTNLSYNTAALAKAEIRGSTMPVELPNTGVHVYVGGMMATIYYVSPTQINFLVPAEIPPSATTFQVVRDGAAGPRLPVNIVPVAPAFYLLDSVRVVAELLDGSVITTGNPAHPGDIVILYATGLGQTMPPLRNGEVPQTAKRIADQADLKILLNGKAVDAGNILYAGTAPMFSGLYQINLRLPSPLGTDPEIRIGMADQMSPTGIKLVVRPAQ